MQGLGWYHGGLVAPKEQLRGADIAHDAWLGEAAICALAHMVFACVCMSINSHLYYDILHIIIYNL